MLATRPTGKKILLIVEDDFVLGEALSLALAAEGYMVAIAANGQDALEKLRGLERPHLILLDLMLPAMSGWQLRDRLRQDPALASIPVRPAPP
jgi:CheY-like chemotaxis protein